MSEERITEQKVICTFKENGDQIDISIVFEPELAGEKSKAREAMSSTERSLQNAASHVASAIVEALKG